MISSILTLAVYCFPFAVLYSNTIVPILPLRFHSDKSIAFLYFGGAVLALPWLFGVFTVIALRSMKSALRPWRTIITCGVTSLVYFAAWLVLLHFLSSGASGDGAVGVAFALLTVGGWGILSLVIISLVTIIFHRLGRRFVVLSSLAVIAWAIGAFGAASAIRQGALPVCVGTFAQHCKYQRAVSQDISMCSLLGPAKGECLAHFAANALEPALCEGDHRCLHLFGEKTHDPAYCGRENFYEALCCGRMFGDGNCGLALRPSELATCGKTEYRDCANYNAASPSFESLEQTLEHSKRNERLNVGSTLRSIGITKDLRAPALLLRELRAANGGVGYDVQSILVALGNFDVTDCPDDTAREVARYLESSDATIRKVAAVSLGRMGAREAIPNLISAIEVRRDDPPFVYRFALRLITGADHKFETTAWKREAIRGQP